MGVWGDLDFFPTFFFRVIMNTLSVNTELSRFRIAEPLFFNGEYTLPTSPKEFDIVEIGIDTAMCLNELWHSMLPRTEKSNLLRNTYAIYFAAKKDGIFYASAIWTSPVAQNRLKDGKQLLELRRFAISEDSPRNTASFMLKKMRLAIKNKFPDIIRLISYQDTSNHHGTIYKADNWVNANICKNVDWATESRNRNDKQKATGEKVRWEYLL
jgi:hypothetical protein